MQHIIAASSRSMFLEKLQKPTPAKVPMAALFKASRAASINSSKSAPVKAPKTAVVSTINAAPAMASKAKPVKAVKASQVKATKTASMKATKAASVRIQEEAQVKPSKAALAKAQSAFSVSESNHDCSGRWLERRKRLFAWTRNAFARPFDVCSPSRMSVSELFLRGVVRWSHPLPADKSSVAVAAAAWLRQKGSAEPAKKYPSKALMMSAVRASEMKVIVRAAKLDQAQTASLVHDAEAALRRAQLAADAVVALTQGFDLGANAANAAGEAGDRAAQVLHATFDSACGAVVNAQLDVQLLLDHVDEHQGSQAWAHSTDRRCKGAWMQLSDDNELLLLRQLAVQSGLGSTIESLVADASVPASGFDELVQRWSDMHSDATLEVAGISRAAFDAAVAAIGRVWDSALIHRAQTKEGGPPRLPLSPMNTADSSVNAATQQPQCGLAPSAEVYVQRIVSVCAVSTTGLHRRRMQLIRERQLLIDDGGGPDDVMHGAAPDAAESKCGALDAGKTDGCIPDALMTARDIRSTLDARAARISSNDSTLTSYNLAQKVKLLHHTMRATLGEVSMYGAAAKEGIQRIANSVASGEERWRHTEAIEAIEGLVGTSQAEVRLKMEAALVSAETLREMLSLQKENNVLVMAQMEELHRLKRPPGVSTRREEQLWEGGYCCIAGYDESGTGAWAGPVVAAACVIPRGVEVPGIRDSKRMPPERRAAVFDALRRHSDIRWTTGVVNALEVKELGASMSSRLAMSRARAALMASGPKQCIPDYSLVDGHSIPQNFDDEETEGVPQGDARHRIIAAASIIATETRHQLMQALHSQYPEYGFNRNHGYASEGHLAALAKHGYSEVHCRSTAAREAVKKPSAGASGGASL